MVNWNNNGPVGSSTKFQPSGISQAGGAPPGVVQTVQGGLSAVVAPVGAALQSSSPGSPSPVTILMGLLAFIVLLRIIGDHPKTQIEGAHIHVGGYNVLVILGIVWFGTVSAKAIVNMLPSNNLYNGLKSVINAA